MQQSLPQSDPVFLIETDKIDVNPYQPRRSFDPEKLNELASSIRELGMLQPIIVTKLEEDFEAGTRIRYELIAGERRLRAAKLLQMPRIPAIIKNVKLDQHRLEMAVVENVQRANLNPIESAKAYNRLQDEFHLTQREIASRVGKSRESVANTMRLLNLPSEIQQGVADGKISESQARLLLSIEEISVQQKIFRDILDKNMSVRETKNKVDEYKKELKIPRKQNMFGAVNPQAINLQKSLEEFLGASVKLESRGEEGKITIPFHSLEELAGLVEKMTLKQGQGYEEPENDEFEQEERIDALYNQVQGEEIDDSSNFGLDNGEEEKIETAEIEAGNEALNEEGSLSGEEDEFHSSEEEHEADLPMLEPEQELVDSTHSPQVDSRDEHDPFRFHGT